MIAPRGELAPRLEALFVTAILGRSDVARRHLRRAHASGLVAVEPTPFQLALGVGRMWRRLLFATDTVGTSRHPIRSTRRARLLANRALRLPVLLALGAVVPLDLTGLKSSARTLRRHLLVAHHDGREFVYDLELLALHGGELEALRAEAASIARGDHPRAELFRDLAVFDGYHDRLLAALDDLAAGRPALTDDERGDPDLSFLAFVRWCAARPPSLAAALAIWDRRGGGA